VPTAAPGGPAFFAYSTNYLIDTAHGVILDVEATPAHRTAEVESTKVMVERIEERFDLTPTETRSQDQKEVALSTVHPQPGLMPIATSSFSTLSAERCLWEGLPAQPLHSHCA
jgi:hypothetical protein